MHYILAVGNCVSYFFSTLLIRVNHHQLFVQGSPQVVVVCAISSCNVPAQRKEALKKKRKEILPQQTSRSHLISLRSWAEQSQTHEIYIHPWILSDAVSLYTAIYHHKISLDNGRYTISILSTVSEY